MPIELAATLGILAGVLGVVDMLPYLRDTVRRVTRPHRGTWLIWSVLAGVALLTQRADGASWSLVMCGVQFVTNIVVFALAIRLGTGGVTRADRLLLALAAAGVAGWLLAGDPLIAIACVVVADLLAVGMMLPKSWCDPGSETLSTFALASLSGVLAAGAAGLGTVLVYPAYYCLVNAGVALLLWWRRRALDGQRREEPVRLAEREAHAIVPEWAVAAGTGRVSTSSGAGVTPQAGQSPAASSSVPQSAWSHRRRAPPPAQRYRSPHDVSAYTAGHRSRPACVRWNSCARRAVGTARDEPFGFERVEARAEDGARDVEVRGEPAEALHAHEQVTHDQQRPALADDLERAGERAGLPVVVGALTASVQ